MIHNSSVIDKKAKVPKTVKIGPFCYVGPEVELSDNVELVSTYELLSPLLALCFGVPGSKKFKQQVNDLIRARDIKSLEDTYLNLLAA